MNTWGNVSIALFETNTSNHRSRPKLSALVCISISWELHPRNCAAFQESPSDYGISFPDKKILKVWKENQEKVSGKFAYEEIIVLDKKTLGNCIDENYTNLILRFKIVIDTIPFR